MTKFRRLARAVGMRLVHLFGARLRDAETGEVLGRVLIVPWRGRVHVIGLEELTVRPVFIPQERLTYWKQDLGFTRQPPPDFPREAEGHKVVEIQKPQGEDQPARAPAARIGSYMMASLMACL